MRTMIGLLAVLIFAGVPFSTLAATYSGPAPADEYFGPHHQSILEIRNRLDRMDAKSDRELVDSDAVVELDDISASISDWRSQYPQDPWLPRTYARLLHDYHRAGSSSSDVAVAMLNEMKGAYPDAPETAAVLAMTYGGGATITADEFADEAPVAPAYQPAYAQPAYQQPAYAQPVYQQPIATGPMLMPVATTLPPMLPSGAWARFDNMRSTPAAPAPTTKTTVTTTVTTTTTSGGP
jgi:hypothetical protein